MASRLVSLHISSMVIVKERMWTGWEDFFDYHRWGYKFFTLILLDLFCLANLISATEFSCKIQSVLELIRSGSPI